MQFRIIPMILGAAIAIVALLILLQVFNKPAVEPLPEIVLSPVPAPLDAEISDRLIERFIAEDEGIQSALKGGPPKSSTEVVSAPPEPQKSQKDILFELMAPWVFVKYRKFNQVVEGQFYNTYNRKMTPYLEVGGTLVGASITRIDSDRATVKLDDATQDLLYVSMKPPPFDPTVPRTPEQIKEAQRRYHEFVYKPSVVMGRKYNELAGRPKDIQIPPRKEQLQQAMDYLDLMEDRINNSEPVEPPKEAILDPSTLDDRQRELYDTYLKNIKRTPEEIRAAIEEYREKIRQQQAAEEAGQPIQSTTATQE